MKRKVFLFLLLCLAVFVPAAEAAEPVKISGPGWQAQSGQSGQLGQSSQFRWHSGPTSSAQPGRQPSNDGAATVDTRARLEKQRSNYTWSIGYGLGFEVSDKVSLDLGYRFGEIEDLEARSWSGYQDEGWSGLSDDSHGSMHQLGISLRYRF